MKPTRRTAERLSKGRSADLAGSLHEVSNALTVVLGWLDNARTLIPPGKAREALDIAFSHAKRGHSIARQAIGAEADGVGTSRSAVALARDASVGVAQEAARRRVSVDVDDNEATDLPVHDAPAALQILINLLLNGIEFSPPGASVSLSVSGDGGQVEFSVTDSGPGIPPDRLQALFSSPDSTRHGGAGIGLRHSHVLAQSRGGMLTLAQTGPSGTCFCLKWPVGEAPSRTVQRSSPPRSLDGMRLLLLEDDGAVRSLVELGLGARGAEVAAASTEQEFDAVLSRGVFDAALLDLSPIEASADHALERIRQRHPDLPIVIISGSAAPEIDTSDVSAWVRKPFEVSELADALTRVRMSQ